MNVIETAIPGVLLIEPQVFGDQRGFFMETWQQSRYMDAGMPERFVQDNLAYSACGVLRGLHIQNPYAQGKLVQVLQGEVYDVALDVRRGSPYFGRSVGVRLSAENRRQFYVPEGFAHGYYVLSEDALFVYKCTDLYHAETQFSVRWDDPDLDIPWPLLGAPSLAEKDADAPRLADIPVERLPTFG